jgi:hypothetical protein
MGAGNWLALQVGDGVSPLGKGLMAAVYLLEFNGTLPAAAGGTLSPVQSVRVPGVSLPDSGEQGVGALAHSLDGSVVSFLAYSAEVGSPLDTSGQRALVRVNRWGFASKRVFSGPGKAAAYAAATCDNKKVYVSTSTGVYSSSYDGQGTLSSEGGAATLRSNAISCVKANATHSPSVCAAVSSGSGYLFCASTTAGASLGAAPGFVMASALVSQARGFALANYSRAPSFAPRTWILDSAVGLSLHWSPSVGTWVKSAPSVPAGAATASELLAVATAQGANGLVWVASAKGVFAADPGSPASCTVVTTTPCDWVNSGQPLLRPLGWGGAAPAAFRGLAPVPNSTATAAAPRPFSPGSVVAVRVGDGAAALSAAGAPVYLEEYAVYGALLQSILLTDSLVPAPFKLPGTGAAGGVGLLAGSANGYYLTLGAYDAASATSTLLRVVNSGAVDFSTVLSGSSGVASAVVSNAGDAVWACSSVAGISLVGGVFSGLTVAGTRNANAGCTYATFMPAATPGGAGSANTLWVAAPGGVSTVMASSPSLFAASAVASAANTSSLSAPRQLAFSSPSQMWVADHGVGVVGFAWNGTAWGRSDGFAPLVPCATLGATTCTTADRAVTGLAVVPASDSSAVWLLITTASAMYAVDVRNPSTPAPLRNLTALVAPRANMAFYGLARIPLPPPGGDITYPGASPFLGSSVLLLRAADGVTGSASRLFVDEVEFASRSLLQSWAVPSATAGARLTLGAGSAASSGVGQLALTPDGAFLTFAGFDVAPGTGVSAGTGIAWPRTVAAVSCRGTASFSPSARNASAVVWTGAAGASGSSASTAWYAATGTSVVGWSGGLGGVAGAPVAVASGCAGGWGGVVVAGPATAPSTYAWGRGCGIFFAPGTPLADGGRLTIVSDLAPVLDLGAAGGGFAVVPYSLAASSPAEFWYVVASGARNAFASGASASSRGAVEPPFDSDGAAVVAVGASTNASTTGQVWLLTRTTAYSCVPLACGPGVSTVALTEAGNFRTAPGAGYANSQTCNITVALPSGYRAGVALARVGLAAGDFFSVTDNSGADVSSAGAYVNGASGALTIAAGSLVGALNIGASVYGTLLPLAMGATIQSWTGGGSALSGGESGVYTVSLGSAASSAMVGGDAAIVVSGGCVGNSFTVAAVRFGVLTVNMRLQGAGITPGTFISIAPAAARGAAGAYTLNAVCASPAGTLVRGSRVYASGTISGTTLSVTVAPLTPYALSVGMVFKTTTSVQLRITALGTGTGGTGTYSLNATGPAITQIGFFYPDPWVSFTASINAWPTLTVTAISGLLQRGMTVFGTATPAAAVVSSCPGGVCGATLGDYGLYLLVSSSVAPHVVTGGVRLFFASLAAFNASILPPISGSTAPPAVTGTSNTLLMSFTSDGSGVGAGVLGAVFAYPTTCGSGAAGGMAATSLYGSLSPGGLLRSQADEVGALGARQRCDWLIPAPNGVTRATLTVASGSLPAKAYLTLYSGTSAGAPMLARVMGAAVLPGTRWVAASGALYATLYTPDAGSWSSPGFVGIANFTGAAASSYAGNTTCTVMPTNAGWAAEVTAPITSANWLWQSNPRNGGSYASYQSCGTLVTAPVGYRVNVSFLAFKLETNWDFLTLFDGESTSSAVLTTGFNRPTRTPVCRGTFSGNPDTSGAAYNFVDSWCYSSGRNLFIRFFSDSSVVYTGAELAISFVFAPTSAEEPAICESSAFPFTIGGANGGFAAGDTHYLNTGSAPGLNCRVIYAAPSGYVVKLTLLSWAVRPGDYLALYDGPGGNPDFPAILANTSAQAPASSVFYSSGASLMLHFVAGSSPDAGISFRADAVALSAEFPDAYVCSRLVSSALLSVPLGGSAKLLTNPGGSYGNGQGCAWTISAVGANVQLRLSFSSFQTERLTDVVTVYDGGSAAASVLAALSGSALPDNITSSGASLHVTFVANDAKVFAGVAALVEGVTAPVAACAAGAGAAPIAVTRAGTRLRTSTGATYGAGVSCQFSIIAPSGWAVAIRYAGWAVAAGDAWTVYDGANAGAPVASGPSAASAPTAVASSGSSMYVTFTSAGGSAGGAGVTAWVEWVRASTCTPLWSDSDGGYLGVAQGLSGCGFNDRRL